MPTYLAETGTVADGVAYRGFVALAPEDVALEFGDIPIDQVAADKLMAGLSPQFSVDMLNIAHFAWLDSR